LTLPTTGVYFSSGGTWNHNGTTTITITNTTGAGFGMYALKFAAPAIDCTTEPETSAFHSLQPTFYRCIFFWHTRNMEPPWPCHHCHDGIRFWYVRLTLWERR
jgi:hypothetical protein